MRKWFSSWCECCGNDTGYWQDVAEGPITPEQYEQQRRSSALIMGIWGGQIRQQLEDGLAFNKLVNVNTDKTVNFTIKKDRD